MEETIDPMVRFEWKCEESYYIIRWLRPSATIPCVYVGGGGGWRYSNVNLYRLSYWGYPRGVCCCCWSRFMACEPFVRCVIGLLQLHTLYKNSLLGVVGWGRVGGEYTCIMI